MECNNSLYKLNRIESHNIDLDFEIRFNQFKTESVSDNEKDVTVKVVRRDEKRILKKKRCRKKEDTNCELKLVMEPQNRPDFLSDTQDGIDLKPIIDHLPEPGTSISLQQVYQPKVSHSTDNKNVANDKMSIVYLCNLCQAEFLIRSEFDKHYRESYNKPPTYQCSVCFKEFLHVRSFHNHFNRHWTEPKFLCTVCRKRFMDKRTLDEHLNYHKSDTEHKCPECLEKFSDVAALKSHCRKHRADDIDSRESLKYECSVCGKVMMSRSSLNTHAKIHSDDRQYCCTICPQKFVQKINLLNHLKMHTGEKAHTCNECGKGFVGISQLNRHKTYHLEERPFICIKCSKSYKTERDLKLHNMIHAEQRPHACSHCDKTFLSTSKLKQHYNIHTGARPFKCKYCSKDFTNFPNWLKHIRRRHKVDHKTGEQLEGMPKFLTAKKSVAKSTSENVITMRERKKGKEKNNLSRALNKKPIISQTIDDKDFTPNLTDNTNLMTITLENEILPLNTFDDLERAAAILMQQSLDMDDDVDSLRSLENSYNFNSTQKSNYSIDESTTSSLLNSITTNQLNSCLTDSLYFNTDMFLNQAIKTSLVHTTTVTSGNNQGSTTTGSMVTSLPVTCQQLIDPVRQLNLFVKPSSSSAIG